MSVPQAIRELADMFDRLPGVGPRAALRYAYWLATQPKTTVKQFADKLSQLAAKIVACQVCGMWTETSPCSICADPRRDDGQLCIVANSQDIRVLEDASVFQGKYHVLGGLLDPIEGRTPDTLQINNLLNKLKDPNSKIREVVLALDPDVSGDTTSMYLMRQLAGLPISISRLARGIPTGAQIEYADEATITDAYLNRRRTKD
ncbi:MAG: recombination mediator RecR [Patescibacteria group bacterium]|nr:recombination mediator RecR [Patescibacteria group bacterium]